MKSFLLLFWSLVSTAVSFANDRINIDITPSRSTWYTSPWLWILGVFVFILLLVAIISSAGRNRISSTNVIVTKKVIQESDMDAGPGII